MLKPFFLINLRVKNKKKVFNNSFYHFTGPVRTFRRKDKN